MKNYFKITATQKLIISDCIIYVIDIVIILVLMLGSLVDKGIIVGCINHICVNQKGIEQ